MIWNNTFIQICVARLVLITWLNYVSSTTISTVLSRLSRYNILNRVLDIMVSLTLQHRRTHNLLLISKLLNQRETTSPFTLIIDILEQSGKPLLRECIKRANVILLWFYVFEEPVLIFYRPQRMRSYFFPSRLCANHLESEFLYQLTRSRSPTYNEQ